MLLLHYYAREEKKGILEGIPFNPYLTPVECVKEFLKPLKVAETDREQIFILGINNLSNNEMQGFLSFY
jgi:hypothetical protein